MRQAFLRLSSACAFLWTRLRAASLSRRSLSLWGGSSERLQRRRFFECPFFNVAEEEDEDVGEVGVGAMVSGWGRRELFACVELKFLFKLLYFEDTWHQPRRLSKRVEDTSIKSVADSQARWKWNLWAYQIKVGNDGFLIVPATAARTMLQIVMHPIGLIAITRLWTAATAPPLSQVKNLMWNANLCQVFCLTRSTKIMMRFRERYSTVSSY